MEQSDATKYKSKIMGNIITNSDVFKLINNTEITSPHQMKDKNVFSRMRLPNTTMTVNNYICFDFNAKMSQVNDVYENVTINIAIVCNEKTINCDGGGNRHDELAGVIADIFNWSNILGLQIKLLSDTETIWEKVYHVRLLQFKNLTLNSIRNGAKINDIK